MAFRYAEKNGEVVGFDDTEYASALANGWVAYDPVTAERDPRDVQAAVVNFAKGTIALPVKAAAPAGPNVVGEVYVATGGVVKVCTVAGSPGTWVSVGAQT